MAWFKVDDGFWCHPKVLGLPDAAIALWVRAGSYCGQQLTDGFLPDSARTLFGHDMDGPADALVDSGLWTKVPGGYQFHDWHKYQPTRGGVEAERAADRERKRKARAEKARIRAESDRTPAGIREESALPVPSRPDPTPIGDTQGENTRETRLPKTWAPTAEHIKRCQDTGLDLMTQVEKFRAHAQEKGRTAKSWNAAFTRWLINAKEYADRDSQRLVPQQRRSSTDERVAGWLALGEEMGAPQGEPDWKELTA